MANESLSQLSKTNLAQIDSFKSSLQETQKLSKSVDDMQKANEAAASPDKLQSLLEDNSALGIQIRTKKLEVKKEIKTEKAKQAQASILVRKEDADSLADEFSQRQGNREYRMDPRLLSELAEDVGIGIHENSPPDELISLIRRRMTVNGQTPDVVIIDKAFEFLLETTRVQLIKATGPAKERLEGIYRKLEGAKFKHFESHAVEIQVAQKIIGAVDAVIEKTGETLKDTLNRYREVVHNPPDIQTLRKYFQAKGYKAMILELKGLSTYLGGNFKRANLENPELMQLASAAKKMQAILNVFRLTADHSRRVEKYLFDYIFAYSKHAA